MKQLVTAALAVGAVVAGTLSVTSPASAAAGVTLTGPRSAGYGATVTLSGHTATPKSAVAIYFHRDGVAGYSVRRRLTSNAAGTFTTTYVADTDYRYYAVADGRQSAFGLTGLPSASCITSGPAFTKIPLLTQDPGGYDPQPPFANFEATDSAGDWAG